MTVQATQAKFMQSHLGIAASFQGIVKNIDDDQPVIIFI